MKCLWTGGVDIRRYVQREPAAAATDSQSTTSDGWCGDDDDDELLLSEYYTDSFASDAVSSPKKPKNY